MALKEYINSILITEKRIKLDHLSITIKDTILVSINIKFKTSIKVDTNTKYVETYVFHIKSQYDAYKIPKFIQQVVMQRDFVEREIGA
jgi:hypothetical protein